jgi:prephenate dehydratase
MGSYSEEAVSVIFGGDALLLECEDFDATFAAVRSGNADSAVIPVENRIVGQIDRPVELLNASRYKIIERLSLRVRHVLAGAPKAELHGLKSVRSHIEALKQCRRYLSANPHLTQVVGADTASSVRRVVDDGDLTRAAIGSRRAAELYGADVLQEDIADDIDNWTIFYLIGN